MFNRCPGLKDLTTAQGIAVRTCPRCGAEVEFFSDDLEVECPKCGRPLHKEATDTCVSWCQYSLQCIEDLKKRGIISQAKAEQLEQLARKTNRNLK